MSSENLDLTTQIGEVKSYSGDEIKNYFENKFKEIKSQEPAGVKLVDKDADGNSKYVFDEDADNSIYKDKQLIETARAYYYERDGLDCCKCKPGYTGNECESCESEDLIVSGTNGFVDDNGQGVQCSKHPRLNL